MLMLILMLNLCYMSMFFVIFYVSFLFNDFSFLAKTCEQVVQKYYEFLHNVTKKHSDHAIQAFIMERQ